MRIIFSILLFIASLNCNAQVHKTIPVVNYTDTYAPSAILVGTFSILQLNGDAMSSQNRNKTALIGMTTSVGVYFIIRAIKNKSIKINQ
jgi:hypothetical protein